jgi:hypothetical protein
LLRLIVYIKIGIVSGVKFTLISVLSLRAMFKNVDFISNSKSIKNVTFDDIQKHIHTFAEAFNQSIFKKNIFCAIYKLILSIHVFVSIYIQFRFSKDEIITFQLIKSQRSRNFLRIIIKRLRILWRKSSERK